jgi:hypothetical protein
MLDRRWREVQAPSLNPAGRPPGPSPPDPRPAQEPPPPVPRRRWELPWPPLSRRRLHLRRCSILVRGEDRGEQPQDHDAHQDHHDEAHHREPDPAEHSADVEKHSGRMAGEATIDPMTAVPDPTELSPSLVVRRGKIVFRARRPVALVLPLLAVTEIAGIICLLIGATIGWFIIAAPVIGLGMTAVVLRPALELTSDGLVQRQYPYSSLTKWASITQVGLAKAGNRTILAYKLVDGIPPPRHQPARALLVAVNSPYDGGWFADSLVGGPEEALKVVRRYLQDPSARELLPAMRR